MVHNVIQSLSPERFNTYLVAAGHDQTRALKLYIWNAHVGEAFHTPIQAAEVSLRNKIDHALTTRFGTNWWKDTSFRAILDREGTSDMEAVFRRLTKKGIPIVTSQVVAGLSFGFWVAVLQPRFNPDVWSSQLRLSFPDLPPTETRHSLCSQASKIAFLRNRISHHEPIFNRNLSLDYSDLMKFLTWVCPSTQTWIRPQCRVPALLRLKP
jgi:hypothetical protein